jgi:hypothetical protein
MKPIRSTAILLMAILFLAAAAILSMATEVSADAGGWPTTTPTPTELLPTAEVVINPETSADILPQGATIEENAPLPGVNTDSQSALAQQENLAPDTAQQAGGSNALRAITTIGIIFLVVIVIGFVVFRLRS